MTSEDRRQARYLRRKRQRYLRKRRQTRRYNVYQEVFSYGHLYLSYKMSRRNVSWKSSVQKYISNAPLFVYETWRKLMDLRWQSDGFYEFDIFERGKKRHIRSVTIDERVVQRCLCDYSLVPMLKRTFIYDNAASLKYRGYHFAIKRLCVHLRRHFRKYGNSGYILLYDFKKFFDNISHEVCKRILRKEYSDEQIIDIVEYCINAFGDVGLGLGSQISQIFALSVANRLDHFIKEMGRFKGYGRYMDDGYVICESKERLKKLMDDIRQICALLGITLNEHKTHIVKISHGFTFLKARIFLTETGRIIKKMPRYSITKERRKLKKLKHMLEDGIISYSDYNASFQSWLAYAKNFDSWNTIQSMTRCFENT